MGRTHAIPPPDVRAIQRGKYRHPRQFDRAARNDELPPNAEHGRDLPWDADLWPHGPATWPESG